jgi:hypothetical protein
MTAWSIAWLRNGRAAAPSNRNVCAGTLLSREQYLHDVNRLGYVDGRLTPASSMTQSIEDDKPATRPPD